MPYRIVIDSLGFAKERSVLKGELPIAELTRTLDLLADSAGLIKYRVEGSFSSRNRPQIVLKLDGLLSVSCQRCLEGVEYPLDVESTLEFVNDESELTQEELEDDAKDYLLSQHEFDVVSLIEDEVILDLPVAPRHKSCALPGIKAGTDKVSPFSILQSLKNKSQ